VAVLSLALGIGGNTAIFTLLDQVLLQGLPAKNPQELVQLSWRGERNASSMGTGTVSYPFYRDIRDRNQVFAGVICRFPLTLSVAHSGETERVEGELVSGNYFDVLGVPAALGRTFTAADDQIPDGHPLAVLSYDFWNERFGSDPNILGQTIFVNNFPLTVIGVSAKWFNGLELGVRSEIRIPVAMKNEMTGFFVLGLQGGPEQQRAYGLQQFLKSDLEVLPAAQGPSWIRERYRTPLRVLMVLVGVLLLMSVLNVANLLLARSAARQREIAVRLAVGAGKSRLVRQSLTEAAMLALLGGGAGLALAMWLVRLIVALIPAGEAPLRLNTPPDTHVLVFTLAVSLGASFLFGLLPAVQSSRLEFFSAIRAQASSGMGTPRLRRALMAGQVFLSTILLLAAALFLRSLVNLKTIDPGFRAERVEAFTISERDWAAVASLRIGAVGAAGNCGRGPRYSIRNDTRCAAARGVPGLRSARRSDRLGSVCQDAIGSAGDGQRAENCGSFGGP
jgi:predicted permease